MKLLKNARFVKAMIVALAVLLCLVLAVGGTVAWLIDTTDSVVNTFTVGDINIELDESDDLDLKMVPGKTITKDPVVTVKADSEACWLFVKVEKSTNFDTFMTYAMADGWTELTQGSGIYYREVESLVDAKADSTFPVIKGSEVTVKDTVTKDMLTSDDFTAPTLTFTAYAVQKDNVANAATAWALANPTT